MIDLVVYLQPADNSRARQSGKIFPFPRRLRGFCYDSNPAFLRTRAVCPARALPPPLVGVAIQPCRPGVDDTHTWQTPPHALA
jgi:hypothetical protein